jgi:multicomponent Na+:H+ antiporter subunit E
MIIVYFLFASGLWLLLTWTVFYQTLIAGVIVVLLTTLIFGNYFTGSPKKFLQPLRYFWVLVYIPVFFYFMLRANLDVAFRALHPKLPINPGIVKIRTTLKTDVAKTFLANSITLTPGTMTVEIDGDYLYIHWIYVETTDIEQASKAICRPFEPYLRRIFE